jgi:hypothetical protein
MHHRPISRKRLLRLWPAGLLLALFLAALLPSVLRLASNGQDTAWTQVCTPHGMRWVAIAGDAAFKSSPPVSGDSSSKNQTAMGLLDCPLCLLQHSVALPSVDLPAQVAAVQWQGRRLVFAAPPLAPAPLLRHWRPPLRAPPVFSLA